MSHNVYSFGNSWSNCHNNFYNHTCIFSLSHIFHSPQLCWHFMQTMFLPFLLIFFCFLLSRAIFPWKSSSILLLIFLVWVVQMAPLPLRVLVRDFHPCFNSIWISHSFFGVGLVKFDFIIRIGKKQTWRGWVYNRSMQKQVQVTCSWCRVPVYTMYCTASCTLYTVLPLLYTTENWILIIRKSSYKYNLVKICLWQRIRSEQ